LINTIKVSYFANKIAGHLVRTTKIYRKKVLSRAALTKLIRIFLQSAFAFTNEPGLGLPCLICYAKPTTKTANETFLLREVPKFAREGMLEK
jgi:hypothetical protein